MPAGPDTAASAMPRAEVRPINWPVTVIVFFAGSVLLWADRSNFSVAAAAWAKELNWTPSTIGLMLSAFSLGHNDTFHAPRQERVAFADSPYLLCDGAPVVQAEACRPSLHGGQLASHVKHFDELF